MLIYVSLKPILFLEILKRLLQTILSILKDKVKKVLAVKTAYLFTYAKRLFCCLRRRL